VLLFPVLGTDPDKVVVPVSSSEGFSRIGSIPFKRFIISSPVNVS